ncbi:MAG: energy-coupling factor transporter transmembrane component T, partial [Coprococcus sp.]
RIAPYLSLILSMTLRFIPEFAERFGQVYRAQKAAGYICEGKYFKRIRTVLRVFSTVVTWALERAVITADSMKSRGYGLKGRKAYSIYRFTKRDGICMIYILFCALYVVIGGISGAFGFWYYPAVSGSISGAYTVSLFVVYGMLAVMPIILRIMERQRFRYGDI